MPTSFSLPELVPQEVFAFLLVFARVGAIVSLMPALAETVVPPRVRLIFAAALAFVAMPSLAPQVPVLPDNAIAIAGIVGLEVAVGLFFGLASRLLMSALQVAGTLIAMQTGLGFAMAIDPTQGSQSALIGTFLSLLGITLIFATGLHHLLIGGVMGSYELFTIGTLPPVGDAVEFIIHYVSLSFLIGFQIAAPFVIFGLVFYAGVGVLSRLMPQVQIFFVAMPANILLGLGLLMATVGMMMTWFIDRFGAELRLLWG